MLERYTILQELGRSAAGAVYAARDRTAAAAVALKRLDPALLTKHGAALAARFLERARSARLLKHRNIVEIHDAFEEAGTAYVAMELLEGKNLRALLDEGPLPVTRAIQIAHDVASGLAHAHLQGAVHGGLAPSNVIVLRSGAAKITDFGTAQAALLSEPADHRADVFALGALFYEMLTRRPPSEGASRPSELNPNAPRALDAVVSSMLARQPADRMAGVPILLRELERLEEGLGLASGPNAPIGEPAPGAPERPEPALRPIDHEAFARHRAMMERESRRRPAGSRTGLLAALGLLLAALGIGFGSYMYYSSGPGARQVATAHPQEAPAAPGPTAPPPVAEASKEPVAAFSPWKEAPPRVADNPPTEQPQVTARAAVRPIAPAPIAKAITEPAPAPVSERESPGMLFGLSPKPILADPAPLAKTADLIEPGPAAPEPAPKSPRPVKAAAKAPAPQPAGTAQLVLAVSPGGELYIDGERRGATPQVTTFDLEPGMHRIEVRSGSRKPFLTYMTLAAGDVRRIRHDFDAKPSRPPG